VLEETDFDRIKIKGYVVHGEMAYQAWINGFRLGEVPIHFKNRARDASKLTSEEITMALLNFAALRFRYGFRPRPRPGVIQPGGATPPPLETPARSAGVNPASRAADGASGEHRR
jgi:hypothetical protein